MLQPNTLMFCSLYFKKLIIGAYSYICLNTLASYGPFELEPQSNLLSDSVLGHKISIR